jgi:hypothetical protein
VTHPEHGLGDRVADAARHVVEALERDVETLATPTPVEAIAETAAAAQGADVDELAAEAPGTVPVQPLTEADLEADDFDESDT